MSDLSACPPLPDKWDASQIPSQQGRVAIVTGANSGIGYETALELAPGKVEFAKLDLGDLSSVKKFSEDFKKSHTRLDLLINNAGIMGGAWGLSVDGYERQFATNHLGHFALTAQMFPLLQQSTPSRIVNVSSIVHRSAPTWNEDEIMTTSEDKYREMDNYGVTKLSNILFTNELARRIKAAGIEGITAAACHPGVTATNLATASTTNSESWLWWLAFKVMGRPLQKWDFF
ncbi:hypothetical protein Pcac1_g12738 [Phytophthora cactorum]|nr:hypothetical protein Pcac1_g12738 [Phytophthora cactorum]